MSGEVVRDEVAGAGLGYRWRGRNRELSGDGEFRTSEL
jgi:hypothetical protein